MQHVGELEGARGSHTVTTCRRVTPSNFFLTRVYTKEEKRVSNVLYGLCKMFSESHAPGIQTLTNESTRFKYVLMSVASSASKFEHNSD